MLTYSTYLHNVLTIYSIAIATVHIYLFVLIIRRQLFLKVSVASMDQTLHRVICHHLPSMQDQPAILQCWASLTHHCFNHKVLILLKAIHGVQDRCYLNCQEWETHHLHPTSIYQIGSINQSHLSQIRSLKHVPKPAGNTWWQLLRDWI